MVYPSSRVREGGITGVVLPLRTIRAHVVHSVLPRRTGGQTARAPQCHRAALAGVVSLQETKAVREWGCGIVSSQKGSRQVFQHCSGMGQGYLVSQIGVKAIRVVVVAAVRVRHVMVAVLALTVRPSFFFQPLLTGLPSTTT